jgi:hypothetical protein
MRRGGDTYMGTFDPDGGITEYSLKEAIEDGVLVEVFKNRWGQLSGGKPIVASINIYEQVSKAQLIEIWNGFVSWKGQVFPKRSSEERLFSTEVNGMVVWVMEDAVCYTIMYPTDY